MVTLDGLSGGAKSEEEIDVVVLLTKKLMQDFTFKTLKDTEEIYYYDSDKGIYLSSGEIVIKRKDRISRP